MLGFVSKEWNKARGGRDCVQPVPNTQVGQCQRPEFFDVTMRGRAAECEGDEGVQEESGANVCRGKSRAPILGRCCHSSSTQRHNCEVVGTISSHEGERGLNILFWGGDWVHGSHFWWQATRSPIVIYALHVVAMQLPATLSLYIWSLHSVYEGYSIGTCMAPFWNDRHLQDLLQKPFVDCAQGTCARNHLPLQYNCGVPIWKGIFTWCMFSLCSYVNLFVQLLLGQG